MDPPPSESHWPSVAPPTSQTAFPPTVRLSPTSDETPYFSWVEPPTPKTAFSTSSSSPTSFLTNSPTAFSTSNNDESGFDYLGENKLWLVMWLLTMVVFIALPFATNERRRKLCFRGIRERRWINEDEYGSEDQQGSRHPQQRDGETQRHFTTTRTQEDDIRQQYLSFLMENYTMVSERLLSLWHLI